MPKDDPKRMLLGEAFASLFSSLEPHEVKWIAEAARGATFTEIEKLELELSRMRAGFQPLKPHATMDWDSKDYQNELRQHHKSAIKRLAVIDALIKLLEHTSNRQFAIEIAEAFKGRV
jgi:hypothetical protein